MLPGRSVMNWKAQRGGLYHRHQSGAFLGKHIRKAQPWPEGPRNFLSAKSPSPGSNIWSIPHSSIRTTQISTDSEVCHR